MNRTDNNSGLNMWKKLAQLSKVETTDEWQTATETLGLSEGQSLRLMVAMQEAKKELLGMTGQDDEVYQVWSLEEWCHLVHILEEQANGPDGETRKLAIPLVKQFRMHPAYPVYAQLKAAFTNPVESFKKQPITDLIQEHMTMLEVCITKHELVEVEQTGHRPMTVIPCKLMQLEGEMTLIGEESHNHSLVAVNLAEVTKLKSNGQNIPSRSVAPEVAEFVRALRSMGDSEIRLILKVTDVEHFSQTPHYEFLRKTTLITNPEGDLIWAAYVEPSEALYEWLSELGKGAEILDPPSFMADYEAYCQEKLRKIA